MSTVDDATVTIIRGEDKTLTVRIVKNSDGEPYDLTGYTTISALFKKQDGTTLTKTTPTDITIVGNAVLGKIQISLTDSETLLLKKGTMSFDVQIDSGTIRRLVTYENKLIVQDKFTA
jgi:hypothetical protein